MTLSEIKSHLYNSSAISFKLPDGSLVPSHFHVTEIGQISKQFIDCGGTFRNEEVINFQLWSSTDFDHRLHPEKLVEIIELAEQKLSLDDSEIEVEYQGETIQKFGLGFNGESFELLAKKTDCLAKDNCGIPEEKPRVKLSELQRGTCTPNSGCC